jgi:hypothetical protein
MPPLVIEYHDDADRLALEWAIDFFTQSRQWARNGKHSETESKFLRGTLVRGRRKTRPATCKAHAPP